MIKELVKLANHLDAKGLRREANYLDGIISRAQFGLPDLGQAAKLAALAPRVITFLQGELTLVGTGAFDPSAAAKRACVEFRADWDDLKVLLGMAATMLPEELKVMAGQLLTAMNEQGCTAIPKLTFEPMFGKGKGGEEQPSAVTPPASEGQFQEVKPNWMHKDK